MESFSTDNMDMDKNDSMYTGQKEEFYDCVESFLRVKIQRCLMLQ